VAAAATLCLLAAASGRLHAQRAMSQYVHDEWTSDRGFPGGAVHAVTQTTDGYLWIGAEKGLVRFDGLAFKLLAPTGIPNAAPAALGVVAAPDGSVWARLRGIALLRHRTNGFENILPTLGQPESVVTAMGPGRDGSILTATLGLGAQISRNGRVDPIVDTSALTGSSFVISMAQTPNGEFWLGTRGAGVLRVQGKRITRLTDGLPDLKVNSLLAMDNGDVWIGTDKGVARWTGTAIGQSGMPGMLADLQAFAMIRDRSGNVWIAAGSSGLVRVDDRGQASRWLPNASRAPDVSSVFEDRDGNIWVGTDRGIERWRNPPFTTFSTAQGLPSSALGPIYVDDHGRAWFAPTTGGLFWIENGIVGRVNDAGLDRDVVYSIDGAADDVWVGRQQGGVTRLHRSPEGWSATRFTEAEGLPRNGIYVVTLARDGALWAGTLSAGASRIVNGHITTFTTASGLASNTITSIAEGLDGTMWFATPGGLDAYSQGRWRTYTTRDGLPSNEVNTVFVGPRGIVWAGTTDGLAVVQDGRLRTCGGLPAPLGGSILGMAMDRSGSLWIHTIDHVLRVNREPLLRCEAGIADVREYGVADGLPPVDSMKRHRTLVTDSHGRVWIALSRGISVADPGDADAHTLPALTQVESISADGAPVDIQASIEVPPGRRRIAFAYTALSLSVPERVRYRYRLDGFDSDWSEPTSDRQTVYTNLGHGQYRFRVIASNSDGLWNGPEASLGFEIRPMLWQTPWFIGLAAAVGVAVLWGLYRLRLRQLARQLNVRFDERLSERTRVARDIHDTFLQTVQGSKMVVNHALENPDDQVRTREALKQLSTWLERATAEARVALNSLRGSATEENDLVEAFRRAIEECKVTMGQEVSLTVQGTSQEMHPVLCDEVYRIGYEALRNACVHSGGSVHAELRFGQDLLLRVADDGVGMDSVTLERGKDSHFGLQGMRERATRIGARLTVASSPGSGTEIVLTVPGRFIFARPGGYARTNTFVL
jgi:ligand-binding sensor domain-containing protein/signal transduction histidine kinase